MAVDLQNPILLLTQNSKCGALLLVSRYFDPIHSFKHIDNGNNHPRIGQDRITSRLIRMK